jgi:hypothetical protein
VGSLRRIVPVLTLAGLALVSCSSHEDARALRPAPPARTTPTLPVAPTASAPTPAPTPSGTAGPSLEDARQRVDQVGLKQSDLGAKGTVKLRPHGDEVAGYVTLDNCGFTFTTEAARTARRQVDITLAGQKEAAFSNEVVTYPDDETAARAMEEERQSLRGCDGTTPQPSTSGGSYLFEVREFTEHAGGYPVDDALSLSERLTSADGTQIYLLAVFLHEGTVLDGHYYASTQTPTPEDVAALTEQARITAGRLAATSI